MRSGKASAGGCSGGYAPHADGETCSCQQVPVAPTSSCVLTACPQFPFDRPPSVMAPPPPQGSPVGQHVIRGHPEVRWVSWLRFESSFELQRDLWLRSACTSACTAPVHTHPFARTRAHVNVQARVRAHARRGNSHSNVRVRCERRRNRRCTSSRPMMALITPDPDPRWRS